MNSSKQTKMIHLGPKAKIQPANKQANKQNEISHLSDPNIAFPQFRTPYSLSKPIVIRYIDPRIVPLFMELGKITKRVQNIVSSSGSPLMDKQDEIQTLIRSTKEINEKVSLLMEENYASFSASSEFGNIINKAERVNSQYQYLANKFKIKQSDIVESQPESSNLKLEQTENDGQVDMVGILNRVSERLQELQDENQIIKMQLIQQKVKSTQLQRQKSELCQALKQKDNLNKTKISQLQEELTLLATESSTISSRLAKLNLLISQ